MTKTVCDRCGSDIKETESKDDVMWYGHKDGKDGNIISYKKTYDLCTNCITDLKNWINHSGIDVLTEAAK